MADEIMADEIMADEAMEDETMADEAMADETMADEIMADETMADETPRTTVQTSVSQVPPPPPPPENQSQPQSPGLSPQLDSSAELLATFGLARYGPHYPRREKGKARLNPEPALGEMNKDDPAVLRNRQLQADSVAAENSGQETSVSEAYIQRLTAVSRVVEAAGSRQLVQPEPAILDRTVTRSPEQYQSHSRPDSRPAPAAPHQEPNNDDVRCDCC